MKRNPSNNLDRFYKPACLIALVLLLAALGELATPLGATDRHWTGSASGDWSNPNNWDRAGKPQTDENLIFDHDSNTASVSPRPAIVGANYVATNATIGAQKFFRLVNP